MCWYNAIMKIKEVTILRSLNPIEREDAPSDNSYEFLHNLQNNKEFIKNLSLKRKEYGIPETGFDINKELGKNLHSLNNNYLLGLKLIAQDFSKSTGDNEDYLLQILLLIFYNSILEVTKIKSNEVFPIEFVFGRRRVSDRMWDYNKEVGSIIIPFNITKTALKKWIDDNWDSMCNEMSDNYTANPTIQRIHKNILKEEEIKELKESGKSISQIVEIFKNKYPHEKWYPSKIKKIHADEKQRIELQKLLSKRKTK